MANDKWDESKKVESEAIEGGHIIVDGLGTQTMMDLLYDMKHSGFSLARYKFAAKLLSRVSSLSVLELGCNEGLGALMFEQNTDMTGYLGMDLDKDAISWAERNIGNEKITFAQGDFLQKDIEGIYDGIVSLDVIEHIDPEKEDDFVSVMHSHMSDRGVAIIGTPSIYMTPYASEASRVAHINLYDQDRLYELMNRFFENVFIFNMNDEIVHTGFDKMSCYIFGVGCNKKKR